MARLVRSWNTSIIDEGEVGPERRNDHEGTSPGEGRPRRGRPEDRRRGRPRYAAPGGLRAGFSNYRAFPEDTRQVAEWARTKLKMPLLALGGELSLDEITKKLYGAVAEDVRGGVIPHCGHWVAEERPEYLIDQLLAFFAP